MIELGVVGDDEDGHLQDRSELLLYLSSSDRTVPAPYQTGRYQPHPSVNTTIDSIAVHTINADDDSRRFHFIPTKKQATGRYRLSCGKFEKYKSEIHFYKFQDAFYKSWQLNYR